MSYVCEVVFIKTFGEAEMPFLGVCMHTAHSCLTICKLSTVVTLVALQKLLIYELLITGIYPPDFVVDVDGMSCSVHNHSPNTPNTCLLYTSDAADA